MHIVVRFFFCFFFVEKSYTNSHLFDHQLSTCIMASILIPCTTSIRLLRLHQPKTMDEGCHQISCGPILIKRDSQRAREYQWSNRSQRFLAVRKHGSVHVFTETGMRMELDNECGLNPQATLQRGFSSRLDSHFDTHIFCVCFNIRGDFSSATSGVNPASSRDRRRVLERVLVSRVTRSKRVRVSSQRESYVGCFMKFIMY